MSENLPPLPGTEDPPPVISLIGYVLRGQEWVQVGIATVSPDGKGHRFKLDLAPTEDGDVIELRAVDAAYYPGHQRTRRAGRKPWTSRPKPRT